MLSPWQMQHLNGRPWIDKGLFPLKRDLRVTRVGHNLLTGVHLGCFHTDVPRQCVSSLLYFFAYLVGEKKNPSESKLV